MQYSITYNNPSERQSIIAEYGPYIIFILGIIAAWLKSQFDKLDIVEGYKGLMINWVTLNKENAMSQARYCNIFAKTIDDSKKMEPFALDLVPMMYEKLDSLNVDKLMNAFVLNLQGKELDRLSNFKNLVSHINYLFRVEADIKSRYQSWAAELLTIGADWNSAFTRLERIKFKKINEVGNNQAHSDYKHLTALLLAQNAITTEYNRVGGPVDAKFAFDHYIKVLLIYFEKAFGQDTSNSFLLEMFDQLTNFQFIYSRWLDNKKLFAKTFKDFAQKIEYSSVELDKCATFLKVQKNRSVIFLK